PAASWVDLTPAGATESVAFAASGGQQAGGAIVGGVRRASLWSGTAASWVDLHAFVPAGFSQSTALGISSDGVNTFVAGYGRNSITGRDEALLWAYSLPCPSDLDNDGDFANGLTRDGAVNINDLLSFLVGFEAGNVLVDLDNGTSTGTPDNAVDINDLLFFLARFEAGC
ncbi:GC-type dockerin domain-anchored protein, partial [Limnofasciculus baicalensis]